MSNRNFHNIYLHRNRAISSVGLERCLDRAEVTGSNPVWPTNKKPHTGRCAAFFMEPSGSLLPAWAMKKSQCSKAARGSCLGTRAPDLVLLPLGKKSSGFMLT